MNNTDNENMNSNQNNVTNGVSENEVLTPEVKVKNKFIVPLIIIAILLVALASLGTILYFKKTNPTSENLYLDLIDKLNVNALKAVDNIPTMLTSTKASGDITFDISLSDTSSKPVTDILNNLKLSFDVTNDFQNKLSNMTYGISYKNSNITNLQVLINNKDGYLGLDKLYDKYIKLSDTDLSPIWDYASTDDYKTILNEFFTTLKNNLKDEYFKKENGNLDVDGKNVNVTKYIMSLSKENIQDIVLGMLNDFENNQDLLELISKLSGGTANIESIKSLFETMKNNLPEIDAIETVIYVSKQNVVEKIEIISNAKLVIERTEDKKYYVSVIVDDMTQTLGTVTLTQNNGFKFNLTFEDIVLIGNFEKDAWDVSLEVGSENVKIGLTNNNNSFKVEIKNNNDKIGLNVNYQTTPIEKVTLPSLTNYIESSNITEEELNSILAKLESNEVALTLIKDLTGIMGQSDVFGSDSDFDSLDTTL